MVSVSRMNATNKYIKNHTRRFTLQCNKETDADVIEFLESADNYNRVLKELVRKEIANKRS